MQNERFEVQFVRVNTCFVYLPEHWLRKLSSRANSSLRLRHNERDYYLSWYARPSPDQSRLCLGATFARSLGIKEADEVFVTVCTEQPPALTSLLCAPASENDREIVELQSEIIQMNLLDQVRVVAVDQPIVAWVSKFLSVKLVVKSMNPQFKYGRLEENTEIHIGDATPAQSKTLKEESNQRNVLDVIRAENSNTSFGEIRRVLPLNRKETAAAILPPCRVYTHGGGRVTLARLRKIGEDQHDAKSSKIKFNFRRSSGAAAKETIVEVHPLDENLDSSSYSEFPRHPCVYVGPDLMRSASLRLNAKVVLEELIDANRDDVSRCTSIELAPCSSNSNEAIVSERRFRDWLRRVAATQRGGKVLINSGSLVSLVDDANEASLCSVKLKPDGCAYGFFDAGDAESVQVRVRDGLDVDAYRPPGLERDEEEEDDDATTTTTTKREESNGNVALEVMKDLLDECSTLLKISLSLTRHQRSSSSNIVVDNALIIGAPGSGKTTCCRLLASRFRAGPLHCHTRHLDCRGLKGKKAELVQKLLGAELARACYLQPSILFLDDLDSITSVQNQGNEEEITPDSTNAAKITEIVVTQTRELQRAGHSVALVATCSDLAKLGKKLRDARGVHFFRTHLTIGSLEKSERIKILRSCLEDKMPVSSDIDWDNYANKTEGWVIQDLAVLADKAAYAAWKRHVSEKRLRREVTCSAAALTLSAEDLDATLARSQPASLRGVQLYRGSGHRWRDIGGLARVKAGLVEILHWPLRYPAVFKRAPVKLQSGILLYGMPGTGKTMLAGAIAKECGLNLISVKGPELLSKYIGASEEAVRNVFEKAQRAKPCVLFFDEFDSLAPRRGHDSTGVTDRVVNQLLTHLDGIEGREGVAVVAASSRPDLLDPALLRPGRLDKSLLCPLPDVVEREEILAALCETHGIDSEQLDLRALAAATEDFTGADLNAVVTQAKLCAIEASLESSKKSDVIIVGQEELVKSMLATKPSLLASEKQKYQRIYAKFAKNESYTAARMRHQKATLA